MKWLLSLLFISLSLVLNAQKGAITSAGDNSAKNGKIINWTIGSTITTTYQKGDRRIYTGDIHPIYQIFYSQEKNLISLDCFPNPATNYFNVVLHTNEFEGMQWVLSTLQGERIKTGKLSSNTLEIKINNLSAAAYLLSIYNDNKQLISRAKLLKK